MSIKDTISRTIATRRDDDPSAVIDIRYQTIEAEGQAILSFEDESTADESINSAGYAPVANPKARGLRRISDVAIAGTALIALSPLLLLVAAAVKVTSKGPVIYGSERLSWTDPTFKAWKFRSMRVDADEVLTRTLAENDELRQEFQQYNKLQNDPRVTRLGPLIRKTSIDELPQLINVIAGQMSIVGPRPKLVHEAEIYGTDLPLVLSVKPGLTGLWQVSGRNHLTMAERIDLDIRYVQERSVTGDIAIIAKTAVIMWRPTKSGAV